MKSKITLVLFSLLFFCIQSQAQWTTNVNDIYSSNTGNVGIGTSTPANKLDVNGNLSVGTTSTNKLSFWEWNAGSGFWINIPTIPGTPSGIGSGGKGSEAWIAYAGNATHWFMNSSRGDLCYRNTTGKLLFGNSSAGAAMAVSNSFVGIGTVNPTVNLDVFKTATTNGNDIIANFARQAAATGGSGIVRIGSHSTADLEINSGYSNTGYRYGNYFDFNIVNNNTGGTHGGINLVTNGASRMSVRPNGYIGIGTATPQSPLDVTGEISSTLSGVANFRMISGNYGTIIRNDGSNTYFLLTNSGDKYGSWNAYRPFYIENTTGSVGFADSKIYIVHSTGNLGLGTTAPKAKLHVNSGADNNYAAILATSSSGNNLVVNSLNPTNQNTEVFKLEHEFFDDPNNRKNGYISFFRGGDSSHGFLAFGSNGLERLRIDPEGNIGIGTSAPGAKLEVNEGQILINSGDAVYCSKDKLGYSHQLIGTYQGWDRNSIYIAGYNNSNLSSSFATKYVTFGGPGGGGERMRVNLMNGNVSIGTLLDDPGSLLTVNGVIHAKEVKIDLTGALADYVFNKDYDLMPLNKVEEYVNANSHLPEMPSAAEVKEKGMSIGEMQNKMLQKIEELTLYVIQQQKTIDSQNRKIDELSKQLKK